MFSSKNTILFITHYGCTPKYFYFDKHNKIKKKIADGGSNINIHLIKSLIKKNFNVVISTYLNNFQYEAYFKKNKKIRYLTFNSPVSFLGFYNFFIENIWTTLIFPFQLIQKQLQPAVIISASDFLPDVFCSFILKLFDPKIIWVAAFYLEAPTPWSKNNPYKTNIIRFLRGFVYWLVQRVSLFLVKLTSDYVIITSDPDLPKFVSKNRPPKNIIVIRGGIDLQPSSKYLKSLSSKINPNLKKKYDACFIGRFHDQKGVVELVKIWSLVTQKKPNATLAMIGMGDLEPQVRAEIKRLHLEKNISLLGYLTGKSKYKIFQQSKIVVHPATYDSGGMAACEAMAWGLPGVSFDLDSLKTYYPKGMVKTSCYDFDKFSDNIIKLITNSSFYNKTRYDALDWAKQWGWKQRSMLIINRIF